MYQPPHHREDRLGVQHALIRANPFGALHARVMAMLKSRYAGR
jgi:predicted FMN-binding regulatory protein PaiB